MFTSMIPVTVCYTGCHATILVGITNHLPMICMVAPQGYYTKSHIQTNVKRRARNRLRIG